MDSSDCDKLEIVFERLAKSKFRSRFKLRAKESDYLNLKGMVVVKDHAYDFVVRRLGPAQPENDGKQTPMRNHPVFIAQHATATCCRGCLEKWHGIAKGKSLDQVQIDYIVSVIMNWLEKNS